MEKKVILNFMKKYGIVILGYLKNKFSNKLTEAFHATYKFFINTLWDSIKEDAKAQLKSTIQFIEFYFNSPDYTEKEEMIIDTLMTNINLPLVLKPFRGLLKKILKNKLKKLVSEGLKKLGNLT